METTADTIVKFSQVIVGVGHEAYQVTLLVSTSGLLLGLEVRRGPCSPGWCVRVSVCVLGVGVPHLSSTNQTYISSAGSLDLCLP